MDILHNEELILSIMDILTIAVTVGALSPPYPYIHPFSIGPPMRGDGQESHDDCSPGHALCTVERFHRLTVRWASQTFYTARSRTDIRIYPTLLQPYPSALSGPSTAILAAGPHRSNCTRKP